MAKAKAWMDYLSASDPQLEKPPKEWLVRTIYFHRRATSIALRRAQSSGLTVTRIKLYNCWYSFELLIRMISGLLLIYVVSCWGKTASDLNRSPAVRVQG